MYHLTIFKWKISGIKFIHIVVQPSPPSISRIFSPYSTETLYPVSTNSQILLPSGPACLFEFNHSRYFIQVESYNTCLFVTVSSFAIMTLLQWMSLELPLLYQ